MLLLHRRQQLGGVAVLGGVALVLYSLVFAHTLPRSEPLWLSQQAAAAMRRVTACEGVSLASAGYHEPSLVFLAGRDIQLVDGGRAARLLMDEPCSLALVSAPEQAPFFAALGTAQAQDLAVLSGVNYSKGRKERLTLYRLDPPASSAAAALTEGGS
jgi:hypothetical protein